MTSSAFLKSQEFLDQRNSVPEEQQSKCESDDCHPSHDVLEEFRDGPERHSENARRKPREDHHPDCTPNRLPRLLTVHGPGHDEEAENDDP
jgi:hypothetical protein